MAVFGVPNEFLAALAGALAGGGASLGGSIVVNRRELKRSARFRLHDELLPELEASIDRTKPMRVRGLIDRGDQTYAEPPPVFVEVLAATRRSAALAGGPAKQHVERISDAHVDYVMSAKRMEPQTFTEETGEYEGGSGEEDRLDARQNLVDQIRAFASWVEGKIL